MIDARAEAGVLRLALYSRPDALELMSAGMLGAVGTKPSDDEAEAEAARAHNRQAVMSSDAAAWLPVFTDIDSDGERGEATPAVACGDVHRPLERSGMSLLSLVEIDVAEGLDSWTARGMFLEGPAIHAVADHVFVLARPWRELSPLWILPEGTPTEETTLIHAFDASEARLRPVGEAIAVDGVVSAMTPGLDGRVHAMAALDSSTTSLLTIDVSDDGLSAVQGGAFATIGTRDLVAATTTLYAPSSRNEQNAYTFDVREPSAPVEGPAVDMLGPWLTLLPRGAERAAAIGHAVDAEWNYDDDESYLALLDADGITDRIDLGDLHTGRHRTARARRARPPGRVRQRHRWRRRHRMLGVRARGRSGH